MKKKYLFMIACIALLSGCGGEKSSFDSTDDQVAEEPGISLPIEITIPEDIIPPRITLPDDTLTPSDTTPTDENMVPEPPTLAVANHLVENYKKGIVC